MSSRAKETLSAALFIGGRWAFWEVPDYVSAETLGQFTWYVVTILILSEKWAKLTRAVGGGSK